MLLRLNDCLTKDKQALFNFCSFIGAHWIHIRTTNQIESRFATVWLRTRRDDRIQA